METGTALILVGGLAVAGFLYLRSQQQQADALAAAQAAPGPGVVQKLENTVKSVWNSASHIPSVGLSAGTGFATAVAKGAGSIVGVVKGIF